MKLSYLLKGTPGHPSHPPLTDATIGIYTASAVFGLASALGISESNMAVAWWLTLVLGLIVSAPTAVTGFADWLEITRGTPLWRTATAHFAAMVTATVFFALAAIVGHGEYDEGVATSGALLLTWIGFGTLTLGGWLGGTIVFVHGMRVLALKELRARTAASPAPSPEEEEAAS